MPVGSTRTAGGYQHSSVSSSPQPSSGSLFLQDRQESSRMLAAGSERGGSRGLARECVRTQLRCLRWCGFCRPAPRARLSPRARRAHAAYRLLALAATSGYLMQEAMYAYQWRGDLSRLSRVMFLLLCHLSSLAKQLVFHLSAGRIDRLLRALDAAALNGGSARAAGLRAGCAATARRVHAVYSGCAVLTCTLWLVFPVLRFARGDPVEFAFASGVDCTRPAGFTAVLLYSYYVTTLVGLANTTMDALVAAILHQCKTQFTILRHDFTTLLERARAQCEAPGEAGGGAGAGGYEAAVTRQFVRCLQHYKLICEEAALVQDIFGAAILLQFAVGGWILCMAAYKLVSLSALSIEFWSVALFLWCLLTEMFLYCYYGNELTVESSLLVDALYGMSWQCPPLPPGALAPRVPLSVSLRPALVVSLCRAGRAVRPAAGGVVPLSLDTFVTILKSAYTAYAVLRQTKEPAA